jgi:hypothetical protein
MWDITLNVIHYSYVILLKKAEAKVELISPLKIRKVKRNVFWTPVSK